MLIAASTAVAAVVCKGWVHSCACCCANWAARCIAAGAQTNRPSALLLPPPLLTHFLLPCFAALPVWCSWDSTREASGLQSGMEVDS